MSIRNGFRTSRFIRVDIHPASDALRLNPLRFSLPATIAVELAYAFYQLAALYL
jgi:hypothetical protein